jgi:hypothetical protein
MELLAIKFYLPSGHVLPFKFKFSPQHPVLKRSLSIPVPNYP